MMPPIVIEKVTITGAVMFGQTWRRPAAPLGNLVGRSLPVQLVAFTGAPPVPISDLVRYASCLLRRSAMSTTICVSSIV